jgi:hypothetical protein
MTVINKDTIKALDPCESGYKNYLLHHADFNGSLVEFLLLDNIPYADKVWLAKKLITKNQAVGWAIYSAESVISLYEVKYPDDSRPRKAIEAAKAYLEDPSEVNRKAAANAANAAYAADAAAYAAAYAAYAAAYANAAADAAAYAAADAAAADAAAPSFTAAAAVRTNKQAELIQLLIKAIQETE